MQRRPPPPTKAELSNRRLKREVHRTWMSISYQERNQIKAEIARSLRNIQK
jgi:hypothetical protein